MRRGVCHALCAAGAAATACRAASRAASRAAAGVGGAARSRAATAVDSVAGAAAAAAAAPTTAGQRAARRQRVGRQGEGRAAAAAAPAGSAAAARRSRCDGWQEDAELLLEEGRRTQNIGIVLSFLREPVPKLCAALRRCDPAVLPADALDGVSGILPTEEEAGRVAAERPAAAAGTVVWGPPERWVWGVRAAVPDCAERVRLWRLCADLPTRVSKYRDRAACLQRACDGLKEKEACPLFTEVLGAVRAVGNSLNRGTRHGGAVVFRVENLPQLASVKANDGKTSLMDYIIRTLRRKAPRLCAFPSELMVAEEAAGLSLQELRRELRGINADAAAVAGPRDPLPPPPAGDGDAVVAAAAVGDGLPAVLSRCAEEVRGAVSAAVNDGEALGGAVAALGRHYGEPTDFAVDELLRHIV